MVETILSALAPIVFTLLLGFCGCFGVPRLRAEGSFSVLNRDGVAVCRATRTFRRYSLQASHRYGTRYCVCRCDIRGDQVGFYVLVFALFLNFVFRFSLSESVLAALAASSPAVPFMGPAILGDLFGKTSAVTYRNRFSCHQSHCRPGHDSRPGAGKNTRGCDNGVGDDTSLGLHRKAP